MAITRKQLETFLNDLLKIEQFDDYCPNGLQIEGKEKISKVAFAVSATQESANLALKEKVDALVVHHGLFWHFHGVRPLVGPFAARIFPLVQAKINLFAYHLPLDAHPKVGNNAGIAAALELTQLKPFGSTKRGSQYGLWGKLPRAITPKELAKKLENILSHNIMAAIPKTTKSINSLAVVSGGAGGDWVYCLNEQGKKIDAYLTGEMSEHHWHESQEAGVTMFAGGHHATERFGVLALKDLLEKEFSLETVFFDSVNPA